MTFRASTTVAALITLVVGCAPINEKETSQWRAGETREVETSRATEPTLTVDWDGSSLFDDAAIEIAAQRNTYCVIEEQATYEKVIDTERSYESIGYPLIYAGGMVAGLGCGGAHIAEVGCLGEYEPEGEEPRPYTSSEHVVAASLFFGLAAASAVALVVDGARTIDTSEIADTEERKLGQREEICAEEPYRAARVTVVSAMGQTRTLTLDEGGQARIPLTEFDLAAYRSGAEFVTVTLDENVDGESRELGPLPERWDAERVARFDSESFQAARAADTPLAYFKYLGRYPNGAHKVEAHLEFQKLALADAPVELVGTYLERYPEPPGGVAALSRSYYERLRAERLAQYKRQWDESPAAAEPVLEGLSTAHHLLLGREIVSWHANRLGEVALDQLAYSDLLTARRATFEGIDLLGAAADGDGDVERLLSIRGQVTKRLLKTARSHHLEEIEGFDDFEDRSAAFVRDLEQIFPDGEIDHKQRRLVATLAFFEAALEGREKLVINDPELFYFLELNKLLGRIREDASVETKRVAGETASRIVAQLERAIPMRKITSAQQANVIYYFTKEAGEIRAVLADPDSHKGARFGARIEMFDDLGQGAIVRVRRTGQLVFVTPVNSTARKALRSEGMLYLNVVGTMKYIGENESGRIPKLTAYWGE